MSESERDEPEARTRFSLCSCNQEKERYSESARKKQRRKCKKRLNHFFVLSLSLSLCHHVCNSRLVSVLLFCSLTVPPRWMIEPQDTSVLKGKTGLIDCQADGFPPPSVRWSKTDGKFSLLSPLSLQLFSSFHFFTNNFVFSSATLCVSLFPLSRLLLLLMLVSLMLSVTLHALLMSYSEYAIQLNRLASLTIFAFYLCVCVFVPLHR